MFELGVSPTGTWPALDLDERLNFNRFCTSDGWWMEGLAALPWIWMGIARNSQKRKDEHFQEVPLFAGVVSSG